LAPKPIGSFSYLLDQSESKSIIYFSMQFAIDNIVHEDRNYLLKTSDGKNNLLKKWGNMSKKQIKKIL
jgi:hypothetical protein